MQGKLRFSGEEDVVLASSPQHSPVVERRRRQGTWLVSKSLKELTRRSSKLSLSFPLLSDFVTRKTVQAHGVLMPERGIFNRATFVVDKEDYVHRGGQHGYRSVAPGLDSRSSALPQPRFALKLFP
jgi:hypothetical protein